MEDRELTALAKSLKASDRDAFETLFNILHQNIFNFILYRIKDQQIAEDLLQDVFYKLWINREKLDEHQSIKNYVYTIADNLILNHIRHLKVVAKHQIESSPPHFIKADSPQFILEEKEWQSKLSSAIEKLPEKTKVVFLMSRMEDLKYQEIADRLSISVKTVETHMVKALKTLRESFFYKL
jgi:RNA polymerase sigma-70 factor (ECF subfamily)